MSSSDRKGKSVSKSRPSYKSGSSRTEKSKSYDRSRYKKSSKQSGSKDGKRTYASPIISIIVPLYNEEESLPELALAIEQEFKNFNNNRFEVIFVDDGSTDNSFSIIRQINSRNYKFKSVRFRRNYGKSAALQAGFDEAIGNIVITMDADLQDDPAEIPNLVHKLKEGYDLVSGWKKKRRDPLLKTVSSKFYNFITSRTSGVKLHDHNCGLKAYRKEVIKDLRIYGEMHRYIPALAHWAGYKVSEIPVKHHARRYGKTKFGLARFIKGYLDLLSVLFTTRYFKRPLHFFGTVGSLAALVGFGIDLWLSIEWVMGETSLSNRPLALLGIALIIVGVQFISLGLLGELIAKNTRDEKDFKIKERL